MRPRRVTVASVAALATALALEGAIRAQPPPAPPLYPDMAGAPQGAVTPGAEGSRGAPAPPPRLERTRRLPADAARRALVAARAGSVEVTVGDLEDRLARATTEERARFAGPEGRRALAREVLRAALLAAEAERRGLGDAPEVRIAERRALAEALLARDFDISSFELWAQADARPQVPRRRRALVLFAADRRSAERLAAAVGDRNVEAWLDLARAHREVAGAPHPGGDLGWIAEAPRADEPPIDERLREALWALREHGDASPPIPVGRAWAVVVLGGERDPEPVGPSAAERAWQERERAIREFVDRLRAEHVRGYYPERLRSVPLPVRESEPEEWTP